MIIPINITNGMNICILGMLYHHKNNSFPFFHYYLLFRVICHKRCQYHQPCIDILSMKKSGEIAPAAARYSVKVSMAICIPSLKAYSKIAASAKLIYSLQLALPCSYGLIINKSLSSSFSFCRYSIPQSENSSEFYRVYVLRPGNA